MRTIVVGAGAVGLACAYALRKRGCDVVVVEQGKPGSGCSEGNAGWICPSHSAPLPAPGLTWDSLKWMLRSDSPLYIAPGAVPGMAPWLWRFWRSCNRHDFDRGFRALALLNRGTRSAFDGLHSEGVEFELHRDGLLSVFRDERALAESLRLHSEHHIEGYAPPTLLSRTQVQRLEPSLSDVVVGGLLVGEEYHVRPETLIRGYVKRLSEVGVDVRCGITVIGPTPDGILTSAGQIEGDAVLVAAGAWSGKLLTAFGSRLPIQAAKGYSITVPAARLPLGRPILLADARVACTPFAGATRFAGTLELSGINTALSRRRVAAIRKAIARYFRARVDDGEGVEWVGMRPLAPDGLPLLGRITGPRNLFAATGHGMLGITLAPVTGEVMGDLIVHGRPSDLLSPFSPDRFAR